jgi:hypothetical protein
MNKGSCISCKLRNFTGMDNTKKTKTMNISTVRAGTETRDELESIVKTLGFRTIAHFFTRAMETLMEQIQAGQELRWPLRFETR